MRGRDGGRRWPPAALLTAGLLLTLLAARSATDLRVATDLEELLPAGAPAAEDYRRFLTTFGGFEKVYALVLWRGDDPDAALLAAAADHLGREVAVLPGVASVRSGLTAADEEFLRRRVLPSAPLFLGRGDPEALRDRLDPQRVRRRVAEIRRSLGGPGGGARARWMAADPLGFAGAPEELAGGGALGLVDPLTGAFLSPRGDAALVIVTPAGGELDATAGRALAAGLDRAADAVRSAFPDAPLRVLAVGGPLYAAQDEAVIRGDLVRTITGSGVAVGVLLLLYFGSVGLPVALLAAVAAGVLWTAGLTAAVHGEVSVLGLSFAALLLGLGVDYGIHGASRFRSARLEGEPPGDAVRTAVRQTGPPILASVVTTAAAFLVLSLAHFRPVREMGWVMAGGVVAITGASLLVGAPSLVLLARRRPPPQGEGGLRRAPWRALGRLVRALVALGSGRPRTVSAAVLALSLLAAWGATRLDLSIDLRALRPQDHPAFAAEEALVERFSVGLDTSTVVVDGADLGAALTRARRAEGVLRDLLPAGAQVTSPAHWLPAGEIVAERRALLGGEPARRAAEALRRALAEQGLAAEPFEPALGVLDALGRGEVPAPPPPESWPDWVGELVRGPREGGGGTAVAVRVATPLGTWPEGPPKAVLAEIGEAVPGAAVASVPRLGAELRRVVLSDFSRLGSWSLVAVAAVVLLTFRGRLRPSLLALAPVTLGCLWTLGLAGWAGVRLDPFTVVVAPLLVGIGVDDGFHALVGARVHGGLRTSLVENGRAMTVTSLTTGVAFASLLASRVPSLRAGGVLVAAGAVLCLVATLVALPALDRVTGGAGWPRPQAGGGG